MSESNENMESSNQLTRRNFLTRVGMVGGAAALYETMTAMGLINTPEAWAGPPKLKPGSGKGKKVVILGAGVGGLTAAYELHKAGYEIEVLEAQGIAGGRNKTARRGSKIVEESYVNGRTEQVCQFDEGLYLNIGPGRIPYHHRRLIHYCNELKVPLQVYIMETTANLFQTDQAFKGEAMVNRRIANDTRGYIAELLAKCLDSNALNKELSQGDKNKLRSLLETFGDLTKGDDDSLEYKGSTRSGYKKPLTLYQGPNPEKKLKLRDLLDSQFWDDRFYQPVDFFWQPTLFQPIGGMDQVVKGFTRQIGKFVKVNSVVDKITLTDNGVEVNYSNRKTQEKSTTKADYCVSNIPIPLLRKISANFSRDYRKAMSQVEFADTCKVGWQANERFWESDKYEIYGGISWINDIITQMWYPSYDYFTEKGTLTGAYNFGTRARELANMTLQRRLDVAMKGAEKLHPDFAKYVDKEKGLSIAWKNIPFQDGGWADWEGTDPESCRQSYRRLLSPDRCFHIVGDQMSQIPGWQEGAIMSAQHAVEQIAQIRSLDVPEDTQLPTCPAD